MPWYLSRWRKATRPATAGGWPAATTRRMHWPRLRRLCRRLRSTNRMPSVVMVAQGMAMAT
jgi:hypothetical protein